MHQTSRRRRPADFAEILTDARSGSDEAWESLYRGLAGQVTGYLSSHGARDPEGLAGEVFLQVARDISRFDGDEAGFRSWVFVIAHRRLIDARRAAGRRPRAASTTEDIEANHVGGNVEDEALEQLAVGWVEDILDRLTNEQRAVLALRVIGDLSLEQTAQVMGKRPGAIKALQRRALTAVRMHIEEGRVTL